MSRVLPLCFVLLCLAGISCAPRKAGILLDTNLVSPSELIRLVRNRSEAVRSIDGKGQITFESPRLGGTAAFELSLKKPDSLLVLLEGPFGIDIGTLFLSGEEYIAYNSRENLVITGVPTSDVIQSVLPFKLTFDQMINSFAGAFDLPEGDAEIRRYSIENDQFLIETDCNGRRCVYWIDNESVQVSRLEQYENGSLVMEAMAASFEEEGDAVVPRRISVWFPEAREQISVQYQFLTINPERLSFVYSLPPDARVVRH